MTPRDLPRARSRPSRRTPGALLLLALLPAGILLLPGPARADEWGLGAVRDPFATPTEQDRFPGLALDGYLRLRSDVLTNLDLDRGPTPSTGETFYPLPASDPGGKDTLTSGNLRLRLEPRLDLGGELSVHARLDLLDGLVLGSTPDLATRWAALNAAATRQQAPADSLVVKQAWGQALTPFGLLLAGRLGVGWGLGVVANDGSCLDCDGGDTVDGLLFAVPVLQHSLGLAYGLSATGASFDPWGGGGQAVDADPDDDVRSLSLSLLRTATPAVREVLRAGGRNVLDYGLVVAYRWQDVDYPGATGEAGLAPTAATRVARGFSGVLVDGFLAFAGPTHLLELELVLLSASFDDASLLAGMRTDPVTARQYGGVVRETIRPRAGLELGLELGLASGDPAPGFGARPRTTQDRARAGDLDGPQLALPEDRRIDNLRFSPDYHVDLILWRELVGTVTAALYLRPRVQLGPWRGFTLELVGIYSQAMEATSAPAAEAPLGFETDLALRYASPDGLVCGLQYGLLFPLAGLDNRELGLDARPAQRLHGLLGWVF